jgi:hypothetical protein
MINTVTTGNGVGLLCYATSPTPQALAGPSNRSSTASSASASVWKAAKNPKIMQVISRGSKKN